MIMHMVLGENRISQELEIIYYEWNFPIIWWTQHVFFFFFSWGSSWMWFVAIKCGAPPGECCCVTTIAKMSLVASLRGAVLFELQVLWVLWVSLSSCTDGWGFQEFMCACVNGSVDPYFMPLKHTAEFREMIRLACKRTLFAGSVTSKNHVTIQISSPQQQIKPNRTKYLCWNIKQCCLVQGGLKQAAKVWCQHDFREVFFPPFTPATYQYHFPHPLL